MSAIQPDSPVNFERIQIGRGRKGTAKTKPSDGSFSATSDPATKEISKEGEANAQEIINKTGTTIAQKKMTAPKGKAPLPPPGTKKSNAVNMKTAQQLKKLTPPTTLAPSPLSKQQNQGIQTRANTQTTEPALSKDQMKELEEAERAVENAEGILYVIKELHDRSKREIAEVKAEMADIDEKIKSEGKEPKIKERSESAPKLGKLSLRSKKSPVRSNTSIPPPKIENENMKTLFSEYQSKLGIYKQKQKKEENMQMTIGLAEKELEDAKENLRKLQG